MTPIRVLLVDDHAMFAQSLVHLLSCDPSIEVVGAMGTVADGLEAARNRPVDVLVVDYQLPDGDGIALAAGVQAEVPGAKVLMLTGTRDERVLVRAIETGCSGFVTKDKAVDELISAIKAVASGDAWIPSSLVGYLLPRLQRTYRGVGSDLTNREIEVLELAARGMTNAAIAEELYLSVNTVRNHVQNAIAKLGAHSKLEAVAVAVREGRIRYPAG